MSLEEYDMDLSGITNLQDLLEVLNSIALTYTVDTSKPDTKFDRFKEMGIIRGKCVEIETKCDLCSHKFNSTMIGQEVNCPNCNNKTFVEPPEDKS